jgi:hypothetical protein
MKTVHAGREKLQVTPVAKPPEKAEIAEAGMDSGEVFFDQDQL